MPPLTHSALCPPRLDRRGGHVLLLSLSSGRHRLGRRRRPDLLQWSTRASQHASQPDTAWARRAATAGMQRVSTAAPDRPCRLDATRWQATRVRPPRHSTPKGGRLRSRADFGARLGRRAAKVHIRSPRPQRHAAKRLPRPRLHLPQRSRSCAARLLDVTEFPPLPRSVSSSPRPKLHVPVTPRAETASGRRGLRTHRSSRCDAPPYSRSTEGRTTWTR
jgi:hypothetical protein